jgi:hypothetical protein
MAPRTTNCDPATRAGRLAKAEQFALAASMILDLVGDVTELSSAYVTLCVHGGIAASDVICCARLDQHARGENHAEAIALLKSAEQQLAGDLTVLLGLKTAAAYSSKKINRADAAKAGRALEHLMSLARLLR